MSEAGGGQACPNKMDLGMSKWVGLAAQVGPVHGVANQATLALGPGVQASEAAS